MSKTALVIGATGGIGGAIAAELAEAGWQVTALNRDPETAAKRTRHLKGVTWVKGDAMDGPSVLAAAQGASVIVHAANPPGYRNWKSLVLPMLESSIAAALANDARLMLPGTVYNYGADAGAVVNEEAPQNPTTRKGAIRAAMERRLKESGVKTLILRAGDFFGPAAGNNWFAQGLITPGRPVRSVTYPGPHDVGHAWAYLPDVAAAAMKLIARDSELPRFASFQFGGHWLAPGIEIANAIRRAAGEPSLPIKRLPWWAIRLIAPFNETMREMLEMRYLWQRPLRLENAKLVAFLGTEPHTPLDEAVAATLSSLGSMPETSAASRRALNIA